MLDTTNEIGLQIAAEDTTCPPECADLFVSGEYTTADDKSLSIALSFLEELGVLADAQSYLPQDGQRPAVAKRQAEHVRKLVCFAASFLRVAALVERFSIPMGRHYWTGKSCGYKAAREVKNALLERGIIYVHAAAKQGYKATIYRCTTAFAVRLEWAVLVGRGYSSQGPESPLSGRSRVQMLQRCSKVGFGEAASQR